LHLFSKCFPPILDIVVGYRLTLGYLGGP
jgi:hypothetical protein